MFDVCITPLGSPVVPEVYISSITSSGPSPGPLSGGASSRSSFASKLSSPSPSTITRCRRWGRPDIMPRAMASWSNRRKVFGTTNTFDLPKFSMKLSSCWRKIGMTGLAAAPIRTQASHRAMNSHRLGSWNVTTSPRSTPSAASDRAMRSTRASSSR